MVGDVHETADLWLETTMRTEAEFEAARGFARALMAMVKAARMYGSDHARAASQLSTCWAKLQTAMGEGGSMNIGATGGVLTLDGLPVGDSPVEKGLADLLYRGGVPTLKILTRVTFEEFTDFVNALAVGGNQAGAVIAKLREAFPNPIGAGIRFGDAAVSVGGGGGGGGGGDSSEEGGGGGGGGGFSAENLIAALADPKSLMELLVPDGALIPEEIKKVPLPEKDIIHLMRFASVLSEIEENPEKSEQAGEYAAELTTPMQGAVHDSLAEVADKGETATGKEVVQQMASNIAIKEATKTLSEGKLTPSGVESLFDRLTREMGDAAPETEDENVTPAIMLRDKFWATASHEDMVKALKTYEGWCVPPQYIEPVVQTLLEDGDNMGAGEILLKYADNVRAAEPSIRRIATGGLRHMATTYASSFSEVLEGAFETLTIQIASEGDRGLKKLMSDAYIQINLEAGRILKPAPGHVVLHCRTCTTETLHVLAVGQMVDASKIHEVQLYCAKCRDSTLWSSQAPERRELDSQTAEGKTEKRSGKERRKQRRVLMKLPVRVRCEAPGQEFSVVSKTMDISKGGALFMSEQLMPVGLAIKLLMPYDPGADLPESNAKVVRCTEKDGSYEVAVQIVK